MIFFLLVLLLLTFCVFSFYCLYYIPNCVQKLFPERTSEEILSELSKISPYFITSILYFEDSEFYNHKGVNWFQVRLQTKNFFLFRKYTGASTITLQLSKLRFTNSKRKFSRKLKDFLYAHQMEKNFSKDAILLWYLESIFWEKNLNVRGLYEASRFYYKKEPSDLSLLEAVIMAYNIRASEHYASRISQQKLAQANYNRYGKELRKILMVLYGVIGLDEHTSYPPYEKIKEKFSTPYEIRSSIVFSRKMQRMIDTIVLEQIADIICFFENIRINFNDYLKERKTI